MLPSAKNYQFQGSPDAIAAAAQSHAADRAAQAQAIAARNQSAAQLGSVAMQQPGVFGGHGVDLTNAYGQNAANMFGAFGGSLGNTSQAYFGGLGSLGQSAAGMYGGGASNLANMYSNANSGLAGVGQSIAAAMGNAATSANNAFERSATGGAGALGGLYGSANAAFANTYGSAVAGQAARDQAALQAISNIGSSNQAAQAQLGQSALANYGGLGAAELAANQGILSSANQAVGQIGAAQEVAAGQRDAAQAGALGNVGVATQGAMGALEASRLQNIGNLGGATQGALGGLGAAQAASLANQSIAAANAYGQLGTGMYNMQGQMAHSLAAAAAAENAALGNAAAAQQAAGPQYAKAQLMASVMPGLLGTIGNFGSQMGGLPAGYGGFQATGPEGLIASGTFAGPQGSGGGEAGPQQPIQFNYTQPELPDFSQARLGTESAINRLLANASSESGALRGDLASQFNANRAATIDPSMMNAITGTRDSLLAGLQDRAGADDIRASGADASNAVLSTPQTTGGTQALAALDRTPLSASSWGDRIGSSFDTSLAALNSQANQMAGRTEGVGGSYDPSAAWDQIRGSTAEGGNLLRDAMDQISETRTDMRGVLEPLYDRLGGLMGSTAAAMQPNLAAGDLGVRDMTGAGGGALGGLAGGMGTQMQSVNNDLSSAFGNAMGGLNNRFDATQQGLTDLFGNTLGQLPMFQGAAPAQSNAARIQELENMLPRAQNRQARQMIERELAERRRAAA